ncbi:MAG: PAS domain S-box protein [Rhodocyclaceae bacterium]|nr:PAS domain S-box protein [Rhodocyclaceae bacterium]MBK6553857.1 PAS domain S-box protein [Rhodocyclaceae bacterium]MBK6678206.1 PAS domain S-box protein [Rhodocyclaceae bacterium]MBK9310865.1 PAS domain S-box protein [Rhodocyclaceae bacterium]MBK9954065.1 PAS domain S-box protein [Rhodocyclaceae bacterium]
MSDDKLHPEGIEQLVAAARAGASEDVWLDVIQKMDEVYSDLLQYEVALEDKNAALEESQQFIVSVLTSMSDVLLVCNRAGVIEGVNQALQRLTGQDEAVLKGRRIFDLFADEASRQQAQHFFAGHIGETLHDCEMQLRAADGGAIPVSLNCTPRYSATGKMLGVVITGRPVGELRRAYKALRQAHEDLKRTQQQLLHSEKMASLGRLVAGVAHELNNPISFVFGNVLALKRYANRLNGYLDAVHRKEDWGRLDALRDELGIDRLLADLPSLIEGTAEGAERTRDIVDGLKRFSAVDRDQFESVDLVPVIERAVHWVSKAAPTHFRVGMRLPATLMAKGSAGQLQQVVMNLVQNACDATAGQGEARLAIDAEVDDQEIRLRFADNGPGIARENLPRVFDPFFTTKPVGKGTGLGLAISYGIIERHGGNLAVSNGPGGGVVFTLILPVLKTDGGPIE